MLSYLVHKVLFTAPYLMTPYLVKMADVVMSLDFHRTEVFNALEEHSRKKWYAWEVNLGSDDVNSP